MLKITFSYQRENFFEGYVHAEDSVCTTKEESKKYILKGLENLKNDNNNVLEISDKSSEWTIFIYRRKDGHYVLRYYENYFDYTEMVRPLNEIRKHLRKLYN